MKREVVAPTVEKDESGIRPDDTISRHPAFGGIVAHRISGHRALFGSDFRHRHFMRVTITTSEHVRSLSGDRYHGSLRSIIAVDMTEAQWAEFISAPNIGTGVPCTIDSFNGEMMPLLPDPEDKRDVFGREARKTLDDGLRELDQVMEMLADTKGLSNAARERLTSRIDAAKRQLGPNIDYVAERFGEHMEETVAKARQEIHGHMVRQLTGGDPDAKAPLELPAPEPKTKPGKIKIVKKVPKG
ncbi:hypothetical protein JYP52_21550 [Nitratireductor aquibiodomus]|uniref:hypothetical protein n=1 Tax=Nitratireductor TaxID=245876 RepID=UPI000DDC7405|nr:MULTISPECIES: hypothetical protein [Nitratireductor]MBN7763728.1 hypothetical protein [Nitratireductor aquibiodomus]